MQGLEDASAAQVLLAGPDYWDTGGSQGYQGCNHQCLGDHVLLRLKPSLGACCS